MTEAATHPPDYTPAALPHRLAKAARWLLVVACMAAIAIGVWRLTTRHTVSRVHYQTGHVDRGPIAAKVMATGTLSALITVTVGSQVSGNIATLGADFESVVKKGDVIATIEPSLFRAAVAQARANYLSANATVEKSAAQANLAATALVRANRLNSQGLMSQADVDTARATLDSARADLGATRATVAQSKAALDQAELNLRYTTIISPIDGIVISRNVDIGQTVAAALQAPTLFTIAQDLTHMQVDTNVAEGDVGKIRAQMPVSFTVDAYPGKQFPGRVRQVRDNAQTIQNVVTYDAVIDVDNNERLLKPGMTASVTFVYAEKSDVTRVPTAALRFKPDPATLSLMAATTPSTSAHTNERVVWVQRAGRPVPIVAEIGISDGTYTELVSGDVDPKDIVIEEAAEAKR